MGKHFLPRTFFQYCVYQLALSLFVLILLAFVFQPVGFVTFDSRSGAEAAKNALNVRVNKAHRSWKACIIDAVSLAGVLLPLFVAFLRNVDFNLKEYELKVSNILISYHL